MPLPGLADLTRRARDLLYPLRCVGCGAFDTPLCPACEQRLIPANGPGRCAFCSAAWDEPTNCPRCFHLRDLAGIRAAFEHTGPARQLVLRLKYQRYRDLAPRMSADLAPVAAALPVDAWLPVPLHRSRQRERGFNQAELLLRAAGLPRAPAALLRTRNTGRQARRSFRERTQALDGAFRVDGPRLDGLTVGLVDDVITSGATVRECARVLRDHGARAVWALAFTRASYDPGRPDDPLDA
ncbi:ComF family protein [Tepidiforma sp.]|uniref:ComF family protein n=1 Tax=Tepidiforma sp. TaxID=2682230 RepID=UPI002ADDCC0F|nr:ComF family protein [Tepidiforma sp.]